MLQYKKRILKEFEYLSRHDAYITAKEMAEAFKISEKTIKNDIHELRRLCDEAGTSLEAKKHYGYKLVVEDKEKYDAVINKVLIYFDSSGIDGPNVTDEYLLELLQAILIADEYLTVDDLATMFYVTRTSIIKRYKKIREILASYGLKISSHKAGPMVVGDEYDIRILMLDSIENFNHLNTVWYIDTMYKRFFLFEDDEIRNGLRQILLKTLRKNSYRLRDDITNKAGMYLVLLKKRFDAGHKLAFDADKAAIIRSFKMYPVIKDMFTEMATFTDYPTDDDEVMGLCLYLMTHIDVIEDADLFPEPYRDRAAGLAGQAFKGIKSLLGIDLTEDTKALARATDILMPMMLQVDFGSAQHSYAYDLKAETVMNVLANAMARIVALAFERYLSVELSLIDRMCLAIFFDDVLVDCDYPFKRLSIALTSMYGYDKAELVRKMFLARFRYHIAKIGCYELYELRDKDREDFDVVVIDLGTGSETNVYRYDWPLFAFQTFPGNEDLIAFYERFIIDSLDIKGLLFKDRPLEIRYYSDVEMKSLKDLGEMLSYKHAKDLDMVGDIRWYRHNMTYVYDDIAFFFFPPAMVTEEFLEVYLLKKRPNEVRYVMALAIDFGGDRLKARIMHDFFSYFISGKKFDDLLEAQRPDLIEVCVKEMLRVLPISLI